jgi:hypothetical protein
MKENGDVEFFDLLDPRRPRSEKEMIDERMAICKTCQWFNGKRCLQCGCFMALKTTLLEAHCPIEKW